jgi:hypothetical protein
MKVLTINKSSQRLLVGLMAMHILGTLFAYMVYIKFSSLGDGYNPKSFEMIREAYTNKYSSTVLVWGIYFYLGAIFPGFLAPMLLGIVVAILTWYAFRDVYKYISWKLFWVCNLFPHFLVWSGSSSKEQIVIILGIIVVNFAAKRSFAEKNLDISLIFVLLAIGLIFIIRPNYFIIYFIIFTTALLSPWLQKIVSGRLSVGVYILFYSLLTIVVAAYLALTSSFFSEDVVDYMLQVQQSFHAYSDAGSNRYGIQWNGFYDFLYNSFWAIPQGLIGPTLIESISKPIQFPVFLEGILFVTILGYLFFELLKLSIKSRILRLYILPYFYVCFIVVFVSYPYLMFNPGSALRYKQSIHPILIFYPLLILAYYRINNLMKIKKKKMQDER